MPCQDGRSSIVIRQWRHSSDEERGSQPEARSHDSQKRKGCPRDGAGDSKQGLTETEADDHGETEADTTETRHPLRRQLNALVPGS
jgi:hypothetical protein